MVLLLPPQAYYPVYYKQRIQLYSESEGRAVQLGADTYGVHLWKAMKKTVSNFSVVEVDSVFYKLARQARSRSSSSAWRACGPAGSP